MKIVLFGKNGQVGHELSHKLNRLGKVVSCDRAQVDFVDDIQIQNFLYNEKPDIIVNAVAYTAVDKAEAEPLLATQINATAVGQLASYAKETGALLVHFSTDYVFDGRKEGRYTEEDTCNPLSVYGVSKLAGEEQIIQSGCKNFIFRTSWVYSNRGKNFIRTILKLASSKSDLKIIEDQIGVPTSASLISDVVCQILSQYVDSAEHINESYGTYHLSPIGKTNWYEYAKLILKTAHKEGGQSLLPLEAIHPIPTSKYEQSATRPKNSLLDTSKLRNVFKIELPNWDADVQATLSDLFINSAMPYNT